MVDQADDDGLVVLVVVDDALAKFSALVEPQRTGRSTTVRSTTSGPVMSNTTTLRENLGTDCEREALASGLQVRNDEKGKCGDNAASCARCTARVKSAGRVIVSPKRSARGSRSSAPSLSTSFRTET